ncbi:hypothetical protein M404DRAFT_21803 [Pisolithus tinctorius Marx 270]|uniref:Uncharacterized protein n=1 Tax=Pisolithus tinctorius Marx 270 TaxID=870435 RepID=A0A0C3PNV8_PISTI|nr:hypothetical protein M404DRAFT_21803 [Pisolithus tinctorius Marx 270]
MSALRLITMTDDNSGGWVMINWTQVLDDTIKYNTDDKEEMMRAKAKERKWHKAAEQAWQEEQVWLEAERVERERIEAERLVCEAKEERAKIKKDTEAGPKAASKVDKGKKQKANDEMPEPGPSQKKQVKCHIHDSWTQSQSSLDP